MRPAFAIGSHCEAQCERENPCESSETGAAGHDAGLCQGQPAEHLRDGAGVRGAVSCQLPGGPAGVGRQPQLRQGRSLS